MRGDISLIKGFSFGAGFFFFFFPPDPGAPCQAALACLAARLPAHAGFWNLPRRAPPLLRRSD